MLTKQKTFKEVYETLPANGWLTEPEAKLLWSAVNATVGAIVEVGTYYGRSAVLLAGTGREVFCVDPFDRFDSDDPSGDQIFYNLTRNIYERDITNIRIVRRRVEDCDKFFFPASVGFVYLDGDHTYLGTLNQLKFARRLCPKGVGLHDVSSPDIQRAIDDNSDWLKIQETCERLSVGVVL